MAEQTITLNISNAVAEAVCDSLRKQLDEKLAEVG